MKITNQKISTAFFTAAAIAAFLSACDLKDVEDISKISDDDIAEIESESVADSYFEDADDIVKGVMEDIDGTSGGRVANDDERLQCATVTFSEESNDSTGSVIIDFSDNAAGQCEDPRGNVRKGKIHIEYSDGPAGEIGFTTIASFEDYYINDIKLEGTRTVKRVAASTLVGIRHEITLEDGKATWPDNTFATREAELTGEWMVGQEKYMIDGTASGTNTRGKDFVVEITKTLEYRLSCALVGIHVPAAGTKRYTTVDGPTLTIDFGNGECDRVATVTSGFLSSNVTIGKN